jgi:hypothetical protein
MGYFEGGIGIPKIFFGKKQSIVQIGQEPDSTGFACPVEINEVDTGGVQLESLACRVDLSDRHS